LRLFRNVGGTVDNPAKNLVYTFAPPPSGGSFSTGASS
jgi:hypothetical protein